MDDVCRHLYFSSLQRENGITAQLHALGLDVLTTSESKKSMCMGQAWQGLTTACRALQAGANSSKEVAEAR